jgi:MFS family permease
MNKQIYPLLLAQFLSAFADNAILFTVIAMVMHSHDLPTWYVPALQSSFLVAFVVMAPWVGGIADNYAKSRVLIIANLVKAAGAGLLLCKVEPLLAYCIVGVGAAIYSPAKYGILPELAGHEFLVKANSWIEGSTILAILLGMVVGAKLADYSITMALILTIALFVASAFMTLFLPVRIAKTEAISSQLAEFGRQVGEFFTTPRSRFAILGASLFGSHLKSDYCCLGAIGINVKKCHRDCTTHLISRSRHYRWRSSRTPFDSPGTYPSSKVSSLYYGGAYLHLEFYWQLIGCSERIIFYRNDGWHIYRAD